jgi:hypothetical protein
MEENIGICATLVNICLKMFIQNDNMCKDVVNQAYKNG